MDKIVSSMKEMPTPRRMHRFVCIWVPVIIIISIITFIIWLITGAGFSFALLRGLSVLIIGCPFGIYLSTPIAIEMIKRIADKSGILFKTHSAMENAGKAVIIVLNKTGTITKGLPSVTDVFTADHFSSSGYSIGGLSEDELLEVAALLEGNNNSLISKAIVKYTNDLIIEPEDELSGFKVYPGKGVEGELNGALLRGGCLEFVMEKAVISEEIKLRAKELSAVGKTPIFYSKGKRLLGIIAISDEVKEETLASVSELKKQGFHVVMMTGEIELTATIIGTKAGVDDIISGDNPQTKAEAVKELSIKGRTIMTSENTADVPSFLAADLGVFLGVEDDAVLGAADVMITRNQLQNLSGMVRLSRILLLNFHENYIFTVVYCIVGMLIAGGALYKAVGICFDPLISLVLMLLSVISVVLNAHRLRIYDINDSSRDKPIKNYTGR